MPAIVTSPLAVDGEFSEHERGGSCLRSAAQTRSTNSVVDRARLDRLRDSPGAAVARPRALPALFAGIYTSQMGV